MQLDDNKIVNNYTLVGRVPGGGKITNPIPTPEEYNSEVYLSLHNPDVTTAYRISEVINIKYGLLAYPLDGGTVRVESEVGQGSLFFFTLPVAE